LIFETFPLERFVTLFYCEITESSNRLVLYAHAGHTEPIHFRREDDSFRFLTSTGGILGIVPNQKFSVENIRMKPGDILLIVTDGITEATNSEDIPFGHEQLVDLISQLKDLSAKDIALNIIEKVQHFYATSQYNDDKTLIVIKRKLLS
jgi:sigma-B regulation protein RsbU (phosphoserine phosphatase)